MPEELERRLRAEARARWPGDEARQDRYVYGTLRKTGWHPSGQAPARRMRRGKQRKGAKHE